jgi:hypothetical protein
LFYAKGLLYWSKIKRMKVFLLIVGLLSVCYANGQIQPCIIDSQYTQPGFHPLPDSLDCLVGDGVFNDLTIQFVNFDSSTVSGIKVRVDYLIIDSILNLPCGIRWTTSSFDAATKHRFENQEKGCIRFWGVTPDPAGQYKLTIKVRVKVSLLANEVPYEAEGLGFRFDVRLKNDAAAVCPAMDTTTGATLLIAFCATQIDTIPPIGINEIASFNSFSFYPNPTANNATVSFTADKAAAYTTRIVNIYGQEVSRWQLQVLQGFNTHPIDVSALPAGVYFFTITDGKNTTSQRFVVE